MSAIVSTRYGKLEGEEQSGLTVFKGVPFAAAPENVRRWLPPEKPLPWTGVRDGRRFGAVAPQNSVTNQALAAMKIDQQQSEDCLNLNLWTPALDRARRPVMVWIHGGGFTIGGGSQEIYNGSVLAKRGDVVVVTINYRLGPLGFLRLNDVTNGRIPSSGNEGLLDQLAALQWMRDNIAEFGGDPDNVTIFGESAGGMSVGALLAMPSARGLFHKAIPQSGSCDTVSSIARANRTAERVLSKLSVSAGDADAIRAIPVAQLLTGVFGADGKTPDRELGMAYQPVVDGAVIPRELIEMVAQGSAAGVAVMVGSNLEEWKLFSAMDPSAQRLDKAGLVARMSKRMTADFASSIIASYERARTSAGASITPPELFSAIETDRVFRMPGVRLAEIHGRSERRAYNYLFTWRSPAMRGALGSCHALELGFVFGTNHLAGMRRFAGEGPAAEKLAIEMQDAWIAFARDGNPGWAGYTEARRATMLFGETSSVAEAPFEEERRAWDGVGSGILGAL
ncbi:MAG TPA: carboxylesterase/lipase family protein [Candidatus Acidoferrales bacterium]|nr:carboxylesterase/lipase family protein [Candidatus Acidoferrales bacterium]